MWRFSQASVTCAHGIAPGHEGGAARSAERCSGDVLSELYPLSSKSVNVRSPAGNTEASVEGWIEKL